MNQNYIELAKQKLNKHKMNGELSKLNIFQVAELVDIIKGKSNSIVRNNDLAINNLNLN